MNWQKKQQYLGRYALWMQEYKTLATLKISQVHPQLTQHNYYRFSLICVQHSLFVSFDIFVWFPVTRDHEGVFVLKWIQTLEACDIIFKLSCLWDQRNLSMSQNIHCLSFNKIWGTWIHMQLNTVYHWTSNISLKLKWKILSWQF